MGLGTMVAYQNHFNAFDMLPDEMIVEVFSYLARRDRMSCSMVCMRWKSTLNCPSLWENMVVHLDTDLMEPSTMLLTRHYHMHIRSLELCWANPQLPTRWLSHRFQEITKRACRYIIILNESYVQLQSIKVHDWYEICRFKKLVYHLSLFLKNQTHLSSISFCNAYLNKTDFIKLFVSCRNCEHTLKSLNIRNCCYHFDETLLSVQIISCLELFQNVVQLKADYSTLCREVVMSLLNTNSSVLETLDVYIQDEEMGKSITGEAWKKLKNKFPKLKVAFYFTNINYLNRLYFVLRKEIPLSSISLSCGRRNSGRCYRDILTLIFKYYRHSLENINLDIRNNVELIDDVLLRIVNKCPRLQDVEFCGVIENFNLFSEIFKHQNQLGDASFKYFKLTPKNVSAENQVYVSQMYHNLYREREDSRSDLRVLDTKLRNIVYIYY